MDEQLLQAGVALAGGGAAIGTGFWFRTWFKRVEDSIAKCVEAIHALDKTQAVVVSKIKDAANTRERLILLEPAVNQAHKRLDRLEHRINGKATNAHPADV